MKWFLLFILFIPISKADDLLDEMLRNWENEIEKTELTSQVIEADEIEDYDGQAELYHWELGTPDNIPETEIIYNDSPCQL